MGQDPGLSRDAGAYIRALQWSVLPFLFYLVLRSYLAALERSGLGPGGQPRGHPGQCRRRHRAHLRTFRLPGLRPRGRGLRDAGLDDLHVPVPRRDHRPRAAPAALSPVRALLAAGLAALPGLVAHRRADRDDPRLRGHDLQRRRPAHGPHRPLRARGPQRHPPDRRALLHGAARDRAGRDRAGGTRLRRAATRRASPGRGGSLSRSGSASWR